MAALGLVVASVDPVGDGVGTDPSADPDPVLSGEGVTNPGGGRVLLN